MSYLGTELDLPEGSRLTGITLRPWAQEARASEAIFFLHLIRFDHGVDAGPAVGALATFMSSAVATLEGNEPDGSAWGAIVQYLVWPHEPRRVPRNPQVVADQALVRALNLTGVTGEVRALTLSDAALRIPYERAGAWVDDWPAIHLLIGLLYELGSNTHLLDVVRAVTNPDLQGAAHRDYRDDRLQDLLRDWAATYEGPIGGQSSMNSDAITGSIKPVTMPTAPSGECPQCGSTGRLQYFVWGMPSHELSEDPRAILMGCVVGPGPMPAYRCANCLAEFDRAGAGMDTKTDTSWDRGGFGEDFSP